MLTATKSSNNIILKTSIVGSYQLDRKFNTGSWESWDGTTWGGVPLLISSQNFTDYDLADGVYQYRTTFNAVIEYSTCIPIGSDHVGWTFENYTVPDGLFGEVLTSDDLKYSFMWGIDFLATNGEIWTDRQTRTMVKWSIFQLEKSLNIDIFPREYYADDEVNEDVETSKFVIKEFPYPNRRNKRYEIRARKRPIQEVTRFDFYSPTDDKILDLLPWLRTDKYKGNFVVYPKQGKVQSYTSNSYPWLSLMDYLNYPGAYHINYKTGFLNAELIPEDLRDIVGKITALKMLNVIGDGLLAGFSSSSLSLDGLSESFSSTQSATSVGGNMYVRYLDKDIKIKHMYKNKQRFLDRPVLSVNRKTKESEFQNCIDVLRHDVSKKKCYRIKVKSLNGDIFNVDVTEDHSLFDPNMKEIKGSDVRVGNWLRMMYTQEQKMRVIKIKRLYFVKYMYDLSVDKNENFTANGFVVHNSSYFGARIITYAKDVESYIAENRNKYGNFRIGSI